MFEIGDLVDDTYRVDGVCSARGGMGTILFVTSFVGALTFKVVLKYCKEADEESLKRFRREVRLLASYEGNSKVVKLVDHNVDYDPPYFVMKYYPEGDLLSRAPLLDEGLEQQEVVFLQMIDCIQELHSRNEFHRDIKPQNFLVDGDQIVVSDFGLTTEIGSSTAFTKSSVYWGTHGYIPPEFLNGGFKHADAAGDVFMLGKTMYVLLTKRDPLYLMSDGIPAPILHIIERCCAIPKQHRYQTLADLRQSIVAAYDVLLDRSGGIGKVKQLLSAISDRLESEQKYVAREIAEFIEQLALLEVADQIKVVFELPSRLFSVLKQEPCKQYLPPFLSIYESMVEERGYSWSYAETIADNMRIIFSGSAVPEREKARALELAIRASIYMNRFAAMDTCRDMIKSVDDEVLGLHVASVISGHSDSFVADIEPSECNSTKVASAVRQAKENSAL